MDKPRSRNPSSCNRRSPRAKATGTALPSPHAGPPHKTAQSRNPDRSPPSNLPPLSDVSFVHAFLTVQEHERHLRFAHHFARDLADTLGSANLPPRLGQFHLNDQYIA